MSLGNHAMPNELSPQEQFLIKEYESASQLTYHIDELRNKLTSFFLTFSGVAIAGIALLLKGEARENVFEAYRLVAILLMIIGCLGVCVVAILARLRRAQLEHFRIINNIRKYFLRENADLWNVVQLSDATLPMPENLSKLKNRTSGTYLWLVLIILVTGVIFSASLYLFVVKVCSVVGVKTGFALSVVALIGLCTLQDLLYFALAPPPPEIRY